MYRLKIRKKQELKMTSTAYRKEESCCFTGYRPEKLWMKPEVLRRALEDASRAAVRDGFRVFYSGMARGTDIYAAQAVLALRREGLDAHLVCACPFPGFEKNFGAFWRRRCEQIFPEADEVLYLSNAYHPACYQTRNRYMVDHSARVICVFDGKSGGTKNTLDYAVARGVAVVNAADFLPAEA